MTCGNLRTALFILGLIFILASISIVSHFSNKISKMNQAEKVNQELFKVAADMREFHNKHNRLPNRLDEIESLDNKTFKNLKDHKNIFLKNHLEYILIIVVNDKYGCAIKNEKGNFYPTIISGDLAKKLVNPPAL